MSITTRLLVIVVAVLGLVGCGRETLWNPDAGICKPTTAPPKLPPPDAAMPRDGEMMDVRAADVALPRDVMAVADAAPPDVMLPSADATLLVADATPAMADVMAADSIVPEKAASCAGSVLQVPSDCPTIQQAVNAAAVELVLTVTELTTVLIAPGIYNESVVIPNRANLLITKDESEEVVINGGASRAISMDDSTGRGSITLIGLTLKSTGSTVFVQSISNLLSIESCAIYTGEVGVTVSDLINVQMLNSVFRGTGGDSIGIEWDHTGPNGFVYNNQFYNLGTGVRQCSVSSPEFHSVFLDDTNKYDCVDVSYFKTPGCV